MINESFLIGLSLAGFLSAVIGLEREINGQPAGIRTHLILGIGAALASMLSIAFSKHLANPAFPSDPGRIVAQVVSGVGFLGASPKRVHHEDAQDVDGEEEQHHRPEQRLQTTQQPLHLRKRTLQQ